MTKKCLVVGIFCAICLFAANPAYAENYRNIGLGLGFSNANPTIELNFRPLDRNRKTGAVKALPIEFSGKYYLASGLDLSIKIHVIDKKHIRWHLFDPGIYFLAGSDPLTANDVSRDRTSDIAFGTGIDILPWKNLCISLTVRWFLPDFNSAYAAGADASLSYAVKNFVFNPAKSFEENIYDNGEAAFNVAAEKTRDIYIQALKEPHFQLTLTWYFF